MNVRVVHKGNINYIAQELGVDVATVQLEGDYLATFGSHFAIDLDSTNQGLKNFNQSLFPQDGSAEMRRMVDYIVTSTGTAQHPALFGGGRPMTRLVGSDDL